VYLVPEVEVLSTKEKIDTIAKLLGVNNGKDSPVVSLNKIDESLKKHVSSLPAEPMGNTFWQENLSNDHKRILNEMNEILKRDYKGRKEVLLKRFEATAQTFLWNESLKSSGSDVEMKNEIVQMLQDRVPLAAPEFDIYDVICAQNDMVALAVAPTMTHSKTGNTLRQFVMTGKAPDRGGRTEGTREAQMPKFTERHGAEHKPEVFKSGAQDIPKLFIPTKEPSPVVSPHVEPQQTTSPKEPQQTTSPKEPQQTTSPKEPASSPRGGRGRVQSHWGGRGRRGGRARAEYVPKQQPVSPRNEAPASPRGGGNAPNSARNDSGPKRDSGNNTRGGEPQGSKRGKNAGGGWIRTVHYGDN
jgi:hypothetical protein